MTRLVLLLALLSALTFVAFGYAQGPGMMGSGYGGYGMGPGMMGGGQQGWNYCPSCGQYLGQGGYGMMGSGMMGGGYGMGPGMMMGRGGMMGGYGMGPAYYQQNEVCQKFFDDTAEMRKDFNNKRYDYFEAIRNPKSTPESVAKLEKEIRELQENIYSKAPQGCWQ